MRVGAGIVRYNIDDLQETLLTMLLGGSRGRRDREVLFDTISKVVPDAGFSFVPEFLGQLAELSSRYLSAMATSYRVVACLDEMGRRIVLDGTHLGRLTDLYHERTVKLARDALHFVTEVCGIPREVFASSLTDDPAMPSNRKAQMGAPPNDIAT